MSLAERLSEEMKLAMKAKEKEKLSVIRMLKSSLQNEAIKLGKAELSEQEELTVLSRELKQRKDSLREFDKAGRSDLAEKALYEIQVVEAFMPEQLSEEEVEKIVVETITALNASSKAEMGKVMGALMPKLKGKADGSVINRIVLKHLQ